MSSPKKILVRGVNWLGDAVMTTPALLRMREHFPEARISILMPEKLGSLFSGHPAIDQVLMFSAGDSLLRVAGWIRSEQFDVGVIFPNSPRSALELAIGGVKRRVGYAGPLRSVLLTHPIRPQRRISVMRKRSEAEVNQRVASGATREAFDPASHHALHYLELVAALGCDATPIPPHIHVAPEMCAAVATQFNLKVGPPIVGLNAGAEYGPAKRWPEERFMDAAIRLHKASGCRLLVLGGKADVELTSRLCGGLAKAVARDAVINVAGQTTLRQLCAALQQCDVVLTNDTGPMHLAAAVGTPVVVPFGSTSPELTGPGLPGSEPGALLCGEAPCAPCFLRECPIDFRCMKSIGVEQVVEAVLRCIAKRRSCAVTL